MREQNIRKKGKIKLYVKKNSKNCYQVRMKYLYDIFYSIPRFYIDVCLCK